MCVCVYHRTMSLLIYVLTTLLLSTMLVIVRVCAFLHFSVPQLTHNCLTPLHVILLCSVCDSVNVCVLACE